jgi:hypothetical protein
MGEMGVALILGIVSCYAPGVHWYFHKAEILAPYEKEAEKNSNFL